MPVTWNRPPGDMPKPPRGVSGALGFTDATSNAGV
jgi:hypothetical protein